MPDFRRPYPSDLSDAEWELLAPLLAPPGRCGRPRKWPIRHVTDAIFSVLRSGCAWRMLPREFPPWQTVYSPFRQWHRQGMLRRAHDQLRGRARARGGRDEQPSAAVIDSQAVKTGGVGGPERGLDGAKRLAGRERHILVDTTGLLLAAKVHGANRHDRDGGRHLLNAEVGEALPRLALIWADAGYGGQFGQWVDRERGWRIEVVYRPDRQARRYGLDDGLPRGFHAGWWSEHSPGWGRRGASPRTTNDCRRWARR